MSVSNGEDTGFYSLKPVFDNHFITGVPKLFLPCDDVDRFECFFPSTTNDGTFTSGQSVGLDDDGAVIRCFAVAFIDESFGRFGTVKFLKIGGRYVSRPENVFAEYFTAFELGGGTRGAKDF